MSDLVISAGEPVKSAAFSPDDTQVAILTAAGLTFFDATTGARIRRVDLALTKDGSLENLDWIRPDLLVAWRFDAVQLVTLAGEGASVKPVPCAKVQALRPSPEGDALLIVDGAKAAARVVTLATLESTALRKVDELPVADWTKEGIALWSAVDGKPGKAELLGRGGESLITMSTPKWEQVTAVSAVQGALAAVVANGELHLMRAGEKKAKVVELPGDADPAWLWPELGLAVLSDTVCSLPEARELGTLPEGWMTTTLSHDGRTALLTEPDRDEFQLASVPQPKKRGKKAEAAAGAAAEAKSAEAKPAPRPGLDGRAWAVVIHALAVDGVEGEQVATLVEEAAKLGATAVIDGIREDGLFERLFVGVVAASTSKAATQRATAEPVELGDAACAAAEEKFAALRPAILALLARHDLEAEGDAALYLLQAGPNASATLAAKKGLSEIDEEGTAEPRKKVEVSYDATLSTRVRTKGPATLSVRYL